jgi:hypothetical protein
MTAAEAILIAAALAGAVLLIASAVVGVIWGIATLAARVVRPHKPHLNVTED